MKSLNVSSNKTMSAQPTPAGQPTPMDTPWTTANPTQPMPTVSSGGQTIPQQPNPQLGKYGQKVGKGVVETLLATGKVDVIVALVNSTSPEEITRMKDEVLSQLDPSEFLIRYRYSDLLPGFSGTVLSQSGLEKLASHPLVKKIDLDAATSIN